MRKFFTYCLLAFGMIAGAQNQIITKKLQLNNVPAAVGGEKYLVRGADRVVKEKTLVFPETISEAPQDGQTYVRKDASWSRLELPSQTAQPLKYLAVVQLDGNNTPTVISVLQNTLGETINYLKVGTGTFYLYTSNYLIGGNTISDTTHCIVDIKLLNQNGYTPALVGVKTTGANNELMLELFSTATNPPVKSDFTRQMVVEITVYP